MIDRMNWDKLKGKFIVIDGPDGSGKTTQVQLLNEVMKNQELESLFLRDPGGTRIGEQIRRILLNSEHTEMSLRCEALLYMASRAQLYEQCIAPALKQKNCVICDRWISSTYAYQAVAGRIRPELILKIAEITLERTWPDLTIIIDLPSHLGLRRIGPTADRMEQKPHSFHQQVRQAFIELAEARDDFRLIDGSASVRQVHQNICEVICHYVNS